MKKITLLLTIAWQISFGQSDVQKSINVNPGEDVEMEFPYAELVNVRSWEGSTLELTAHVMINLGENDNSYEISSANEKGTWIIKERIRDYDNLPEMITLKKDGQVYYFETEDWNSPEIKKFYEENGREGIHWISHGVAREITVEVKVPRNLGSLEISSKFGLIDIEGVDLPLKAYSTHGGVDLAVSAIGKKDFILDSKWGTIYSNLELDFRKMSGFEKTSDWNHVECSINGGGGIKAELTSTHGNIYLRKQ